jgi:hypothetical protein
MSLRNVLLSILVFFSLPILPLLGEGEETGDVNPWDLSISERILTRKNISHMVIDPRREEYRLVLITGDRYPYNYKAVSFPFFLRFENEVEAYQMMKKLDKYLESGQRISLFLKGSEIKKIIFHEPYEQLP